MLEARLGALTLGAATGSLVPLPAPTEPGASQSKPPELDHEIQQRISRETRDTLWATKAERDIRDAAQAAVGNQGVAPKLDVRCLTSLCKVDAAFPAGELAAVSTFPLLAAKAMAGFRRGRVVENPDGTRTISFEFLRQGDWSDFSGGGQGDEKGRPQPP